MVMATRHPEQYRQMLVRLRQVREEAGLSQERVASMLGVRQKLISKIETGERRIDPCELYELAQLYGRPLEFFVKDLGIVAGSGGGGSPERPSSGELKPGRAGGKGGARWRKPRSDAGPAGGRAVDQRPSDSKPPGKGSGHSPGAERRPPRDPGPPQAPTTRSSKSPRRRTRKT